MTIDEFLSWAESQPGRYELIDGRAVAKAPPTVGHANFNYRAARALDAAILICRCRCWMLPSGMLVPIGQTTAYVPDALVYCGEKLQADALLVPDPVIVVDLAVQNVPSAFVRAMNYLCFTNAHILSVDLTVTSRTLRHAYSDANDNLREDIITGGMLQLDPPGLTINVDELFRA